MRCRLRLFGQVVFQPFAAKNPQLLARFTARASGQMLVSWHVSETGHLWRSVGAQAYRALGCCGTIDWFGVGLVMRFAPKRRSGSVSSDRGGEGVVLVSLLGGTASGDLNAELLHSGVKGIRLYSQSRGGSS